MRMPPNETEVDPRWVTFWRRVRAAAEQLRQAEVMLYDSNNPEAE